MQLFKLFCLQAAACVSALCSTTVCDRALCSLQITVSQIKKLIDHKDSVYIRAIGFLYLRHCCEPKSLWAWCDFPHFSFGTDRGHRSNRAPHWFRFEPYVSDKEKFCELGEGQDDKSTIGTFVRRLLTEQA